MKCQTIVTVYRSDKACHFVGIVNGRLTEEQRSELAKAFKLRSDEDENDVMFFTEVEPVDDPSDLVEIFGIEESPHIEG